MCACKGECKRQQLISKYDISGKAGYCNSRYINGSKRCSECDIFLDYNGQRCPCCNTFLRGKPRSKSAKERLARQRQELEMLNIK